MKRMFAVLTGLLTLGSMVLAPAAAGQETAKPAPTSWDEVAALGGPPAPAPNVVGGAAPANANGVVTFSSDRATFTAAWPGLALEDFVSSNPLAPGGVCVADGLLNQATNDKCFAPGDIEPGLQVSSSVPSRYALVTPPYPGIVQNSVGPDRFADDSAIEFVGPSPVYAAGFNLVCPFSPGPMNVQVSGAGGVLGVSGITCPATTPGVFVGVVSAGAPITRIDLIDTGSGFAAELLTDVVFGGGATLTLVKNVVGPDFGATFTLSATGPSGHVSQFVTGVPQAVEPGTYRLAETGPQGYFRGSDWSCVITPPGGVAGAPMTLVDGEVLVPAGATVECTITNTRVNGIPLGTPVCIESATVQDDPAAAGLGVWSDFDGEDGIRYTIITGPDQCRFNCSDGHDINCDGRLGDFCPVELDRTRVDDVKTCLALHQPSSGVAVAAPVVAAPVAVVVAESELAHTGAETEVLANVGLALVAAGAAAAALGLRRGRNHD